MKMKSWSMFDNLIDCLGRFCRNGNGNIRVTIAVFVIVGMLLYPFIMM